MIAGISALKAILPPDPLVLDVGACKGEFTAALLEAIPKAEAILFEPTKTNARKLLERFHDNPRVKILECALGNLEGEGVFNRYAESETNSLLNLLSATSVSEQDYVRVETIDGLLRRNVSIGKLDLIKIDTQGTDLRVLKGAEKAIEQHHPVIFTEAIFIALYHEQDSYFDLFGFMNRHRYRLTGFFNAHCTRDRTLAFADFLFVSEAMSRRLGLSNMPDDFVCVDPEYLKQENDMLKATCEERLALIHRLTDAAEERLRLIHRLTETAAERLKVIERLESEVGRLTQSKQN